MQIDQAVQFLTNFNRDLDRAFSSLALSLPEMSDQVGTLIEVLDDLQSNTDDNVLSLSCQKIDALSQKMKSFLSQNIDSLHGIVGNVEETEVHIENLTRDISQIEDLASETKLISLNAAIASERLGAQGRAFGVITQYLTKVSQIGDETALRFLQKTESILASFQTLKKLSEELRHSLDQLVVAVQEKIDPATQDVLVLLESLSKEQGSALAQCRDVLPAVQEVMLLIQNQDVLRQGIEHITIVLHEIEKVDGHRDKIPSGPADFSNIRSRMQELDFQGKAAHLSASLYRDNSQELQTFFSEVDAKLTRVNQVAFAMMALKERLEGQGDFSARISAPLDSLRSVLDETSEMLASYQEFDTVCAGLKETLGSLADDLDQFQGFLKSMNRIRLLMKIESGNVPALAHDAQPITQSIQRIQNELKALLKSTETIYRNLDRQRDRCTELLKFAIRHLPIQSANLNRELDGVIRQMDRSKELFNRNTGRAIDLGRAIEGSVREFQDFLPRLQAAFMEENIIETTCRSIIESAEMDLAKWRVATGRCLDEEPLSDYFLNLISRFTILSHKEILGAISGIAVEEGDCGGELTLF